jgi:hypothetical protein
MEIETKKCSRCKETKPVTDFRWKRKLLNERISMCNVCDPIYRAERYQARKEHLKKLDRECKEKRRAKVAIQGVPDGDFKCIECLKNKPADEFRWLNKGLGYKISRCKDCDAIHRFYLYPEKKDNIIASNKRVYKKLRLLLESYKTGPCCDCGHTFPLEAMDFDHLDPETKIDKVSSLVYRGSKPLLLAEIAKCELVCANCHRIRTANRLKDKNDK